MRSGNIEEKPARETSRHPRSSVLLASALVLSLTAITSCVFEEWGIRIANASDFTITALRLSKTSASDYTIGLGEELEPGEVIEYYWVDYGTYDFYTVEAVDSDGIKMIYSVDLREHPFTVSFGTLQVLEIENPAE